MKRTKLEITDKSLIEKILSSSEICRLGFIDNDRPYVLPFNYGYHDGFIYIHCAREGKKIDLINKNNLVCFEIEQIVRIERHEKACKWETTYRSVVGYGRVEIISDDKQKREGLDVIMKHNGADASVDMEYEQSNVDRMVILKIKIMELTGKQSDNFVQKFKD